jgi:hypothetical protein
MKAVVLVLADTETHEDRGRIRNALETAKEFKDAGDDVKLIFDGAGTRWIPVISKPDNKYNELYVGLKDRSLACKYCAAAFGATTGIQDAGVPLLDEYHGHPSLRKFVSQGYQVISF